MRIRQILESKVLNFISIKNQYHHKVLKSEIGISIYGSFFLIRKPIALVEITAINHQHHKNHHRDDHWA